MKLKTVLPVAALGVLAIIGGVVMSARNGGDAKAPQQQVDSKSQAARKRITVNVRAETPTTRDMYETIMVTGNLEAINNAEIFTKVPGTIKKIYVKEGERVKKNKLLAKIDDEEARLEAARARASVETARVNMENSKNTLDRNKELYAERYISPYQYDQYESNYRLSRTQYNEARAAGKLARLNYKNTRIKSPITGTVVKAAFEPNQRVSSAETLFQIADLSKLRVKLNVIEREIPKISVGQKVSVKFDALAGTEHDNLYEGEVESISPMVNADNGTVEVKVIIPNDEGRLLVGMFARVTIHTSLHKDTMVILKQALSGEEGAQKVFKIVEGPGGKIAKIVDIKSGLWDEKYIEVLSGLNPEDNIVVEGHNLLNDGDPVELVK